MLKMLLSALAGLLVMLQALHPAVAQAVSPSAVSLQAGQDNPIVSQFSVPGGNPRGLAWDGSYLWLVDNTRNVYQLDVQGNIVHSFSISFSPSGMTWDGTALWIGDDANRRQVKVGTDGEILGSLGVWYWGDSGLAWGGQGLWIGDYNSSIIHEYDTAGHELRSWPVAYSSGVEHPTGLAFDGTNLWIGDSNEGSENAVALFNTSGQVLIAFDTKDWGIPPVKWPEFKSFAWDGSYLWYSADDLTTVYRLDVRPWTATVSLGEALDNTKLTWTTGGSPGWFGQSDVYHYGGSAARSGAADNTQDSWIQTTVAGPALLWFWWTNSGQAWNLSVLVDGAVKAYCSFEGEVWGRQVGWIPAGTHTLTWRYAPVLQSPGDAGFLDQVVLLPGPAVLLRSPDGGQTLYRRDFSWVSWVSTPDVGPQVRLDLYQGGSPAFTIAANTINDGLYPWFISPEVATGTDYRVRVTSVTDPSVYDESDGVLTIASDLLPALRGYLLLPGTGSYAAANDDPELHMGDQPTEGLTVEAWINFSDLSYFDIVNKSTYRLYAEFKYQYPSAYNCLEAELLFQGGAYRTMEACDAFSSGKGMSLRGWHHTAMTLDWASGQWSLYLDGERRGSVNVTGLLADSVDPLEIGAGASSALDEVRISDVARYTGPGFPLPTSPLSCDAHTRALWHFDEVDGATSFHDACGAVDNTLVGYNGAHTEGVPTQRRYLPLICR